MKINLQSMKIMNKQMILRYLIENGPTSRAELAKYTKLTPSTVSRIVSDLFADGLIEEIGYSEKIGIGRKPIDISVTSKFVSSVIFNVGVEQTTVAIGFLNKEIKSIKKFHTGSLKSFISEVNDTIDYLEKKFPLNEFTYIVFAFPGIVNTEMARIIYAPNLNWKNVDLKEMINHKYKIMADNEANLSVLAESLFADDARKSENLFFLYISQGIGGGAMINHKILRGSGFAGGEVGHITVEARSEIKCHCGNYGCLERYASLVLPVIEYEKYGKKLRGRTYTEKFSDLVELYIKSEKKAIDALEGFIYYLSIGILNIINTFDPELIIIGGGYNHIWKYFGDEILSRISKRAMPGVLENLKFRDTSFESIEPPVFGSNVLAIENIVNNLN
ncbi:ROK family transcriptional regulator [Athalassotoga saccharophila]|uniref:ROK family transcriptional regulator n=1 Tax=Athalassotoga saccharophila TaxID=1441386 RepID=UPI00137A6EBA|nr:ROK family transcriptional regulator [Athalassotoga saccharophila]BBJ28424.1 N-acetylglucosamine repressor [Athalassotoga saccharophila]